MSSNLHIVSQVLLIHHKNFTKIYIINTPLIIPSTVQYIQKVKNKRTNKNTDHKVKPLFSLKDKNKKHDTNILAQ